MVSISTFTPRVCTYVKIYNSYRFDKVKVFGSNKTSVIWKKKKNVVVTVFWMGREDILGNGWCYKKDCETSCDKICKKHEF